MKSHAESLKKSISFSYVKPILLGFLLFVLFNLKIFFPFTVVPFVIANTLAIMFGIMFGSKKGVIIVLSFLLQFALFSGFSFLSAPTLGYLAGYIFAAYIGGLSQHKLFNRILLSHAIILACGMIWLTFLTANIKYAFLIGFLPFIGFDLIKSIVLYRFIKNRENI